MIKKLLIFVSFVLFTNAFAQKTHTVAKGDNPYNIAKKYGMTMDELAKLNPGIKEGKLAIGDQVKINGKKAEPAKKPEQKKPEVVEKPKNKPEEKPKPVSEKPKQTTEKLGKITLQPKQTIYGITKQYHISESDLRRLNPNLDSGMKIGDEVNLPLESIKKYGNQQRIVERTEPVAETKPVEKVVATSEDANVGEDSYKVQPKDNYYRITKKFGITQSQLFALNPGLEDRGLKPGEIVRIKGNIAETKVADKEIKITENQEGVKAVPVVVNTPVSDDNPTYTVQEGDTVFSILNKFGMTLDELLALNPKLSDGLRAGMVLKVKKTESTTYVKKNSDALNVVLMLPFGFDAGESKYRTMSADFLAGAKLAIERNARIGQKLDIKVVDAGNESTFKNSLAQIDKENTDLIVGPLFKSNVLEVLNYLGSKKIPVIAPFANSEDLFDYSNLIMVQTQDKTLAERIAKEVVQVYSDQKIYIVADEDKANANIIKESLEKTLTNPNIILVNSPKDIQVDKNMMTGQSAPVIAVLASDDNGLGEEFANQIIELTKETSGMKAFSMYYNSIFEKKENDLGQASLVYLMDRKIATDGDFEKEVLSDYKTKYCKTPTKYAIIGFDIMNDALSRENAKGEIFKQIAKTQIQLATKFEYVRTKNNGAYINTGYRVVRLLP